jgi:parvulin-like peptidyl-prolyl isomerase
MKSVFLLVALTSTLIAAPAAEVKPDTVVATMNGKRITAAEFQEMTAVMPAEVRATAMRDPENFFKQYAHFRKIFEIAEKEHFAEQSPTKERLAEMQRQWIVNARVDQVREGQKISPEEQKAYYDNHEADYKATKVQILAIGFGPKIRSEEEARTKAIGLVQQLRIGADFATLARKYSEDPSTRDAGGEYKLPVRPTSTEMPAVLRKPILQLKQGEVSDPIRVDAGFYIAKATFVGPLAYDEVKDEVFGAMKDAAVKQFLDETKKQSSFTVEAPDFFKAK